MDSFIEQVDILMKVRYGISWDEASGDDDYALRVRDGGGYGEPLTALEFVEWFGNKHDLIPFEEDFYGQR